MKKVFGRMVALVLAVEVGAAAWGQGTEVNPKELALAGKATQERIARDGVAWKSTLDVRQGTVVEVERMVHGEEWRAVVKVRVGDQ